MASNNKRSPLRIIISIVIILVAAYFGVDLTQSTDTNTQNTAQQVAQPKSTTHTSSPSSDAQTIAASQRALVQLADVQQSGKMVELHARVVKLLEDDNEGSRHQRFLLAIDHEPSPMDSVLVAHNIDLAPRVPLEVGAVIRIFGQYEWNDRGGVLHWTHHDPAGRHEDGWIEYDGKRYE